MPYCSTSDIPPVKLEAKTVHAVTLDVLVHTVTLDIAGEGYTPQDVLNVVLVAAAKGATIQQAAKELKTAPHPNTVRYHTEKFEIDPLPILGMKTLETELNSGLMESLPKRVRQGKGNWNIAIDITLIPYYGKDDPESDFIIRGPAKSGTTRFFGYISAYVCHKKTRYTLLVYSIRQSQSLVEALKRALARLQEMKIRVKRFYLDRGFYSVAVLQFLHVEGISYVMPVVKRGRSGGLRKLMTGSKSYHTTYTMTSCTQGRREQITHDVFLIRRYAKGKYGQHGVQWFGYAVHRYSGALHGVYEDYRRRFGIESSYRLMNQARARTASRVAAFRYLLVLVAVLLQNLWVYLKWAVVSQKRKGGRKVLEYLFPFSKLLSFLLAEIYRQYGQVDSIEIAESAL
jgi:putative transposase